MKLREILHNVLIKKSHGDMNIVVEGLCMDSRKVTAHSLFVAIKGTASDGHQYIDKAIESGAKVIVLEQLPEQLNSEITYIEVESSQEAVAQMASNFYGNPSSKLKLVGVTGTNGKTTVTTLLYQLAHSLGFGAGLISTVAIKINEETLPATHTTPDVIALNGVLSQMVAAGVEYVFMEVSSHGIHQKRIAGLHFVGGVFTNLTHDHLDYHKTFAAYRDAKKLFFDELPKTAFALVNSDDKNGRVMLQNTKAQKKTYALKTMADYKVRIIENQMQGLVLNINGIEVWTRLIGEFNAYNLAAVYGVADLLGWDEMQVLQQMTLLKSVNGRFQQWVSEKGIIVIVDYAHTPDALENILKTIQSIRQGNETLYTVVGCGGNRDKQKRPKMGDIASRLSDEVILTSDNPRDEEPEEIIRQMREGVEAKEAHKVMEITDRHQAIQSVCKSAQSGDIILIAGKGHETYQEIKGQRYDFDDFKEVVKFLKQYHK